MNFESAYKGIKPSEIDNDTPEIADRYLNRKPSGTGYLAYRDIPMLIQKYVKGERALDFGCGTGYSTRLIREMNFDVVGVDISLNMLLRALSIKDGIPFAHIKHGEINAKDNSFDFVHSSLVFFDMPTIHMVREAQLEISRILKPGGIFIAVVGSENLHLNNWLTVTTDVARNKTIKSGEVYRLDTPHAGLYFYDYYYSDDDYRTTFDQVGLELLETHYPLGRDSDGFPWQTEKSVSAQTIYICRKRH